MKLYRCYECKETFDRPYKGHYYERVEYWGFVTREKFEVDLCPHCECCEDFEEFEVEDEETSES